MSRSFSIAKASKRSRYDLDWEPNEEEVEFVSFNANGTTSSPRKSTRVSTQRKLPDIGSSPDWKQVDIDASVANGDGLVEGEPAKEGASRGALEGSVKACSTEVDDSVAAVVEVEEVTGGSVKTSSADRSSNPVPRARQDHMYASQDHMYAGQDHMYNLSDEVLMIIFSYLPPPLIATRIRFVCRRWYSLSSDTALWKVMDFSFVPLKPITVKKVLKSYCHRTTTKIALKGPSIRPRRKFQKRRLGPTRVNRCLTVSLLKLMKKSCPSLTSFSLSHEQIAKLSLFSHLPATLTHLSLPFCNMTTKNFVDLLKDRPFKQLQHLDLGGATVLSDSIALYNADLTLPETVTSLVLDDLKGVEILRMVSKQKNLTHLSMSYNEIDPDTLMNMAREPCMAKLKSLHLRGCLIAMYGYSMNDRDFEDWERLWTNVDSFPALKRLDVRNVTMGSGESPSCLKGVLVRGEPIPHLVDVDGTAVGDWSPEYLVEDYREALFNENDRREAECRERFGCGRRFGRRRFWGFNRFDDDESDDYDSDDDMRYRDDLCIIM